MSDLPPFDEAQSRLIDFLSSMAACTKVCWVFREDFYCPDAHQVVVPRQLPSSNSALAMRAYDHGSRMGHGVNLYAAFLHDDYAYCSVLIPQDAEDAERCMISGLTLSCRTPLPRVVQVGAVSWLWRRVASSGYRRQIRFNLSAPLRAAGSSTHAPENSAGV